MNFLQLSLTIVVLILVGTSSAPVKTKDTNYKSSRDAKSLGYFDYVQPVEISDFYNSYSEINDDDYADYEENNLARTAPKRKRLRRPQPVSSSFNSPIYYIRLPPQPYMFVPGLGYVSQSNHHNHMGQFLNVPVNFVSNGKPANIYQWGGMDFGLGAQAQPQPQPPPPPQTQIPQNNYDYTSVTKPSKPVLADSTIHRLPGKYTFNGKPDDIFVLRDSYNSLYSDALQNFYP